MSVFQNKSLKNVLKIILPLIFIHYFITISFFTHTHVINGVTIVHSHPYQSDKDGKPMHEHSGTEIQLIQVLSVFYASAIIAVAIFLALTSAICRKILIPVKIALKNEDHHLYLFLRPPPAL